jgi:class 3 adenylate cyclase
MACNAVGAMTLASRLDPEDLRAVMAQYYDCVKEAVGRYGGHVAKHTADGVLVYFGYPQAHEDDAERAVRAGLAAAKAVGELETRMTGEPLKARVGIATGLVGRSNNGTGRASRARGIGETPHLAIRLLTPASRARSSSLPPRAG